MTQITEAPAWLEGLILVIVETPWGKIFEAALAAALITFAILAFWP